MNNILLFVIISVLVFSALLVVISSLVLFFPWVLVVLLLIVILLRIIMFLHMLQLEGYKNKRFTIWLFNNPKRLLGVRPLKDPKKRLVFTARATRLFIVTLLLLFFMTFFFINLFPSVIFLPAIFMLGISIPILLLFSIIVIYPLEQTINNIYLRSAKKRLQRYNPKVIGITGSYGKTSTKDILSHILSTRYKILKTPGSFNTPMGICKVIRGELRPEHEIFIVEMGARERGDIKELCDLVGPEMGVITAIEHQHLEMFKTLENIKNTKYELIDSLPPDGIAVFNNDDENCRYLADKTKDKKVLLYGINKEEGDEKPHLMAMNISTSAQGIYFSIQNSKGIIVPYHCKLLGRHNIYNILASATVALEFGMGLDDIAEAVKRLEPTPHRLQLIRGARGVTIIDDAFNANPVGARMALDVLSEFKEGRKILVTPGLVELGEKEYKENKQLGIAAAKVCDLVFLVGTKRTKPIFEGLREAGFPETNIYTEKTLKDTTERFKDILKTGDVVLFENDLPDTYNE